MFRRNASAHGEVDLLNEAQGSEGQSTVHLEFAGTPVDINNHLKILGICLDNKLSFREHMSVMLKKVYSKYAHFAALAFSTGKYYIASLQEFCVITF